MDESSFRKLLQRAKLLIGDYGSGYQSGLRRCYHGKEYGDPAEHAARERRQDEWGRGYRDGLAGMEPVPLMGRPPLPADAPRSEKSPRTVRLDDERWAKLRRLGTEWLEREIDYAPEPGHVAT